MGTQKKMEPQEEIRVGAEYKTGLFSKKIRTGDLKEHRTTSKKIQTYIHTSLSLVQEFNGANEKAAAAYGLQEMTRVVTSFTRTSHHKLCLNTKQRRCLKQVQENEKHASWSDGHALVRKISAAATPS